MPSLNHQDTSPEAAPGRLLATYVLAEKGKLDYNTQVAFTTPVSKDHDDFDDAILARVREVTRGEMDCHVCYALFCDPVTTPCGHTFCRVCLQRVMDHARICPVCRRELTIQPIVYEAACPSNQLLVSIATALWPELLETRRQAVIAEGLHDGNGEFDLPVFICTLSFPSMPTFLHVFEPKYRLMIRRALEGDRCFGMALHHNGGSVECGTVLRIINVEFFPDGRSLIETVGTTRFRIMRSGVLDGYMVAQTAKINDISLAEEEELEAAETRSHSEAGIPRAEGRNEPTSPRAQLRPNNQSGHRNHANEGSDEFRRRLCRADARTERRMAGSSDPAYLWGVSHRPSALPMVVCQCSPGPRYRKVPAVEYHQCEGQVENLLRVDLGVGKIVDGEFVSCFTPRYLPPYPPPSIHRSVQRTLIGLSSHAHVPNQNQPERLLFQSIAWPPWLVGRQEYAG